MLVVGAALKGYGIEASDGRIGTVADFLFDDRSWRVRWLVVDTGSWLSERKVLIHPSAIGRPDYDRQRLTVKLTCEQVKNSPDIKTDLPVTRQMEDHLYDYYGWDPLWGGSYFGAGAMGSPYVPTAYFQSAEVREAARMHNFRSEGDPDLQSLISVNGYHVHATDGAIGHVENFLIDDSTWGVRYLIVDTRNWWPGKHVLISPYAVREVSWSKQQVMLDLTRDRVKSSPNWEPQAMIDDIYERELHHHYNWPGYGW